MNCYSIDGGLVIPNAVTKIGERAFYYCGVLRELTFGGKTIESGSEAFRYCVLLKRVNYVGTAEEWRSGCVTGGSQVFENTAYNGLIYCSDGSISNSKLL